MGYPLDKEETIEALCAQIGRWSTSKGFREDWDAAVKLRTTVDEVLVGNLDSEMTGDDARFLGAVADALAVNHIGMKLALVQTELSEALESLRRTGVELIHAEGNFKEELADAVIRIFDLADMLGGGLGMAITEKMAVNERRPHKHGKVV